MFRNLRKLILEETYGFDLRWQLAQLFMLPLPRYTAGRVRTLIMRMLGFQIGKGTMMWDIPMLIGDRNLHKNISIGNSCLITIGTYWDLAAPIQLGNFVGISPDTMLLTGTHDIGNPGNRVGLLKARPVVIGDGAWLGARCIVMPGVTIGEGVIVGAGAVVTKDVPPHTVVAGVPAVKIRDLNKEE